MTKIVLWSYKKSQAAGFEVITQKNETGWFHLELKKAGIPTSIAAFWP